MKSIQNIAIAYLLITAVAFVTQGLFFQFGLSHTFWGEYFAVKPAKKEYKVGEQLEYISDSARYRVTDILWEDSLFCMSPSSDELKFVSRFPDPAKAVRPKDRAENKWDYQGRVPDYSTSCCMVSKIFYKPMLLVEKPEIIDGCKAGSFLQIKQ